MDMTLTQPLILLVAGAAAFGIAALLWALRISAGARGAAHLPGMLAAKTALPVLGVPVMSKALNGMDSLLSIAQMPAGIPVATFAIGQAGAANAGLFAAALLAHDFPDIAARLAAFRHSQTQTVLANADPRLP